MFFLCISSCAQPQTQKDFYLGLKNKDNLQSDAAGFFEKALVSSNVHVRQAAAEELANLFFQGVELSAAVMKRLCLEAGGPRAAAVNLLFNDYPDKDKVLAFLLNSEYAIPEEARLFFLRECEKDGEDFFSNLEIAAIEGHHAVSRSHFNEALLHFRAFTVNEEEKWPQRIPQVFLQYPDLINDLGRAFQFTSSGSEGIDLFLQWEKNLGEPAEGGLAANTDDLRYRLLFYAGRIARRRGLVDQGISLFEKARPLAPKGEQADACIWYILDSSLSRDYDAAIQRLEQFVPFWHDGAYFNDILERLSRELVTRREWKNMIRVFSVIRDHGGVSTARYAWIIARAIEEGYLTSEEKQMSAEDASAFMRIAYNAGDTSHYYRLQSAAALDEPFLDVPAVSAASGKPSSPLQFLLGFFQNEAAEFAPQYITPLEKELIPDELRAVAEALGKAEMYAQSMRLVSLYINKDGYTPGRKDLELLYPLAYRELVEKYAENYNIAPALLFGLIRTESAFQSGIVSRAGAVGLTQLMPATAEEMAGRIRRAEGTDYTANLDLSDPAVNIHIGAYYLNYLRGRFNDPLLLLMAYNGGMNRVRRWYAANTLPPDLFLETVSIYETREYGRKVTAAAAVYQYLYY